MWHISPSEIADVAHSALGKIFWGALLCILDLNVWSTSNGYGFKFDFLNDVIGAALIAWGVSELRWLPLTAEYDRAIDFCYPPALLMIGSAILEHFIVPWPALISLIAIAFSLWVSVAILKFCFAMQLLSDALSLSRCSLSWDVSRSLYLYLGLVPKMLFQLLNFMAVTSGQHWNFNIGPLVLAFLVLLVPAIHILISISRMRGDLFDGNYRGGLHAF